ncbi:transglutaminase family protein cysteine peptidase BTLCP [Sphingobium chlorophenolicum L-1]|uniref:Transglutaminase family protein cysteine peptidase BTLCP n=2 Tax=Sphingobium chlorophenolicum TaxID=46429 RepID=F6EX06_SPHCR|nr:transglutaminase family protein cysteine peptidase BTLCP [Sphingobium chlorophenolicum L-1]
MRSAFLSAISAIGLIALAIQPVHARAAPPFFISRGAPVEAPRGFVAMCNTDKTFCATSSHDDPSEESGRQTLDMFELPGFALFSEAGRGLPSPSACGAFSFAPMAGGNKAASPALDELGHLLARLKAVPVGNGASPCTASHEAPALAAFAGMPTAGLSVKPFRLTRETGAATPQAETLNPDDGRRKAALLKEVNNLVNGRVRQRPDMEIYAEAEHWVRSGIGPRAAGDCEDLAIEKRYQLLARGFDPADVSFAVVFSTATGLHTVLVARTEEGDMVLDSATPWVRRADQTGYSWISIQSTSDQMTWVSARV